MNRREKLLYGLDLRKLTGIEIGPLACPMVSKDDGDIIYVDHADTATIREKYRDDIGVDKNKIVEIDGVWGARTLLEAAGRKVDYIVASHVIEHVPNLIAWFEELHNALHDEGDVRLIIPDRRYTFDYFRAETRLSDVITAYLSKARIPQPQQIIDFALHKAHDVTPRRIRKGYVETSRLTTPERLEEAINLAKDAADRGIYHDTHCWVFTPTSFVELMKQLAALGLMKFECVKIFDTRIRNLEFIVALKKSKDQAKVAATWARAAKRLKISRLSPLNVICRTLDRTTGFLAKLFGA
jgi:hypothetical protein